MVESSLDRLLREQGIVKDKAHIEQNSSKRTIIVVDDERSVLDVIVRKLTDYNVIAAESGEEALVLYEQIRGKDMDVYCVIMDAKMPGMSGWEATRKIHQRDSELPVIMLTAFQDEHTIPEAVDHNLAGYVTKGKATIDSEGGIVLPTLDELSDKMQAACNKFAGVLRNRFFEHVTDSKEKEELIRFSMMFDPTKEIPRVMESYGIADDVEAKRYFTGCSYNENSDYVLFAMELYNAFGLRGKKILEFCTGPGDLSARINEYEPARIVGIDGAPYMITGAKKKHKAQNLDFRLADIFRLSEENRDLRDSDLIICQNSIHHFTDEDLHNLFEAALDCLKPGGSFYVSDYRREGLLDSFVAQRLLATNKYVRRDLMNTFQASFTKKELEEVLKGFGDRIEYSVFLPDKEFVALKRDPRYQGVVANDPHPHYLDYSLSLRVHVIKK